MSVKIAVIADDLTGSNDTGVQFAKKGLKTGVIIDINSLSKGLKKIDVLVIDTESRFDSRDVAYEKVSKAASILKKNNVSYIYKKLDSTLRGNIGGEIEATLKASNSKLAIVVPALPQNGRTTIGSIHMVNNIPLEKTEIAKDPITPVKHSYIPEIISQQTNKKIGTINLQTVLKGPKYIKNEIRSLRKRGIEIVVIDAINDNNLVDIAKSIKLLDEKVVIVGSAGLAEFLPEVLQLSDNRKEREGSVIIIAGSVSDITRKQINYATKELDIDVIDINIDKVFEDWSSEKIRILELVKESIKSNKDVIIRSAKSRKQVEYARKIGLKKGLNNYEVSEKIAQFLGEIGKEICKSLEIKGLMLTGGDIAIKTAKLMEATGTIIGDEILPAIPYGYFISKQFGDIPIVTKAGAFGPENTIIKVIEFLKKG
ncbi:four-carbon acid sugar kinase family protein [Thermohalobacter berrensis]|uniref:Serine kinase n=1 Tax=Thermohalobacter berrensis TaxID=99594 RepID=A0A419T119_9FIRM|nr:four-carbon acid sugar kinase family protein [Thermohalobacter berrensis]RKD31270.1 hypothetical protein BET03_03845 [Thermohalobacter berrensis]